MAADPQQSQGVDPSVADALKQHLQIAAAHAKMGTDAMGAAHKQVVSTLAPHADILQALQNVGNGQAGPSPGGEPAGQEAIWSAFPGTDPNVVSKLAAQGPDPAPLFKLFQADEAKLQAMHQASLQAHVDMHGAPQGQPEPAAMPHTLGG